MHLPILKICLPFEVLTIVNSSSGPCKSCSCLPVTLMILLKNQIDVAKENTTFSGPKARKNDDNQLILPVTSSPSAPGAVLTQVCICFLFFSFYSCLLLNIFVRRWTLTILNKIMIKWFWVKSDCYQLGAHRLAGWVSPLHLCWLPYIFLVCMLGSLGSSDMSLGVGLFCRPDSIA